MVKNNIKEYIKECNTNQECNKIIELELNSLKLSKFPSELKKEIKNKETKKMLMVKALDVSFNRLNDFKWDLSKSFDQLDQLNLSGNPLSSTMMVGLPGSMWLRTLTYINVTGCKIMRIGQHDFKHMPALRRINLSNNTITEFHPESMCILEDLEEVNLSGNASLSSFPQALLACKHIAILDASGCAITSLPNDMTALGSVLELNLANNRLNEIPDSIGMLTRLCLFNLMDNNLRNLPLAIANCRGIVTSLKGLSLQGNPLDPELAGFINLPSDRLISYLERRVVLMQPNTPSTSSAPTPIPSSTSLSSPSVSQVATSAGSHSSYGGSGGGSGTPNMSTTPSSVSSMMMSSSPAGGMAINHHHQQQAQLKNQYQLSTSNESWRELPDHIPGPRLGANSSTNSSPASASPLRTSQHSNYSSSPSPFSSSPSPLYSNSPRTSFNNSISNLSVSQEPISVADRRDKIYQLIKNDLRVIITTTYELVNKSSTVEDLVHYATSIKSIQVELDELSRILAYRKHTFPSSSTSISSSNDKFTQLRNLVKSKIEMCVVYSKSIIEHTDLCNNPTDLSQIYDIMFNLKSKLSI